jgi:hypothetical protein
MVAVLGAASMILGLLTVEIFSADVAPHRAVTIWRSLLFPMVGNQVRPTFMLDRSTFLSAPSRMPCQIAVAQDATRS